MTTARRPSRSPNVYRGPTRRPGRRSASPAGIDTMKVAGTLMCVSAVLSGLVSLVSRDGAGTQPPGGQAGALGGAFLVLLFGLALVQGVGAVRILVLVCAALGSLALIAMAAVFHSVRELQLVALAALLSTLGYLVLLLQKEAPKSRVVVAVGLVVAGAAASLSAPLWLSGLSRRAFGDALAEEASDQRKFSDPAAGISLAVPEDWVILREDTELYRGVPSKVTLAHPGAATVAFINYEQRRPGLLTLDHYLDAVLEGLNESGLEAEQTGRSDVTVGQASARRMALTWTEEGRRVSGFFSTWLDGDRIFMFIGAVPGRWTGSAAERFAALEGALQFTAPVETALTEAEERLTTVCPIFTATSVRWIARKIPPGSPTEVYFRTGWSWALKGQGQLDAGAVAELGPLMREVFSAMRPADRQAFGAYGEKLRGGARTSRAEDAAAMKVLGRAAAAMSPDSLGRLQGLTDAALTVGMFL